MKKNSDKRPHVPWRTTPLKTRIYFLGAVFCLFAGIGIANDVIDMGRWPLPRYAISVVLIGVCAIGYASCGIILRNRFWMGILPLMALQFTTMGLVASRFPDLPRPKQMDAADIEHLRSRMAFDGVAVIFSVVLGYVGFVHVSISEARRYARTQAEKATLDGEMAAAREVQRVMVPEKLPSVSGYAIESVYRPAAEVGGDFFQVIQLKSGRTLLVIGDVSGKGVSAAMVVSMIVGMLSVVSAFTEEPAEILLELNRRLCGRKCSGFATCIAVRIESGGRLTLANAGHLPPYLNGKEIPFPGSVPLGLADSADYAQTSLETSVGDRAVLMTDGVSEARNEEGALLGFSRVESLLREGASVLQVAEAAQSHGQNDDITIISIVRQS
jgi:serine phosphatase RsbU (regulator of sigma subunit)